jgi:hypothetical protein
MVNPEKLQEQVGVEFKKFKWPPIANKNACSTSGSTGKFELNNTQKFVSSYFTPKSVNGIFLYHSVGSGKTLSAINLIKNFQEKGFNAIWVTRASLKKDIEKGLTLLPTPKSFPVYSYKQLSNICKRKGENYKYLVEKAKKLGSKSTETDPFYKTVIIIDESHKLYGSKDLKPQEMHDIKVIQEAFFRSYRKSGEDRLRLCLMSGTPITEDSKEVLKLLNLLITNESKRINVENFYENFTDGAEVSDKLTEEFKEKTKGLVSFIDVSKDFSKFAQVKLTEVFVPISKEDTAPELDCKAVYKTCRESGFTQLDCVEAKKECSLKNKIKKETLGKSQTTILKKRCGIEM